MSEALKGKIRDIPDFPQKGIVFKDITPLLGDPSAFREAVDLMAQRYRGAGIEKVVGIEARGFILAAALAYKLNAGVVPIRKPGKLPYETLQETYQLEYGTDSIEVHVDAVERGQKVLLVDDLLATGGTMRAAASLVEKLNVDIHELAFMVELSFLEGRRKLQGYQVFSLINF
jgi:adenine phosphoribosyltransferase